MPLQPGLYAVSFKTKLGAGAGVILLENGQARGGDSALAYSGTYTEESDNFQATIQVRRHSAGLPSVFGIDDVEINLSGKVMGNAAKIQGSSPQAPGVSFEAQLRRLSD